MIDERLVLINEGKYDGELDYGEAAVHGLSNSTAAQHLVTRANRSQERVSYSRVMLSDAL